MIDRVGHVVCTARQQRLEYSARRGKHISQSAVVGLTGVAVSTLSRLESGIAIGVEFHTIARLCALYECDVQDLFQYVEPEQPEHAEDPA